MNWVKDMGITGTDDTIKGVVTPSSVYYALPDGMNVEFYHGQNEARYFHAYRLFKYGSEFALSKIFREPIPENSPWNSGNWVGRYVLPSNDVIYEHESGARVIEFNALKDEAVVIDDTQTEVEARPHFIVFPMAIVKADDVSYIYVNHGSDLDERIAYAVVSAGQYIKIWEGGKDGVKDFMERTAKALVDATKDSD